MLHGVGWRCLRGRRTHEAGCDRCATGDHETGESYSHTDRAFRLGVSALNDGFRRVGDFRGASQQSQ